MPIPKIEVSLYQNNDSRKSDINKDFIEIPEPKEVSLLAGEEKGIRINLKHRCLVEMYVEVVYSIKAAKNHQWKYSVYE